MSFRAIWDILFFAFFVVSSSKKTKNKVENLQLKHTHRIATLHYTKKVITEFLSYGLLSILFTEKINFVAKNKKLIFPIRYKLIFLSISYSSMYL